VNTNNPMNDTLSCQEAAHELEEHLGIMAHGPHVGNFFRSLQGCDNPTCGGLSRKAVILESIIRIEADMVLALRN
jgi:hypothetical protein